MSSSGRLSAVFDLLLKPVPFLPNGSFVVKPPQTDEPAVRRKAVRRGKRYTQANPPGEAQLAKSLLRGCIQRGTDTPYSIDGQDITINSDTWIFGDINYGVQATVMGVRMNGILYAKKIMVP